MNASENKKKYDVAYAKKNTTQKMLRLNNNHDKDILEWLKNKKFNPYIKELIRKDIEESK